MNADSIMKIAPVIPVMVIEDVDKAVPLARALVDGGLKVLEITLRTPTATQSIERIIGEVEGAVVGAGTVIEPAQLQAMHDLGCAFAVSPGFTPRLLDAADDIPCPLLPGAGTVVEMMQLLDRGYNRQKFFPAGPAGGPTYLKSLTSPLPQIGFCPTGGIDAGNASDYLSLPNVICVGGSWVAPKASIEGGDWAKITELASAAAGLSR
jgi:2-dehydro-3-deoxyphosphogluconate aldolase/(4S)-4-hydroxy-2-oxoglutarate aldolase